jgi:hypothetical protein
MTRGLDPVARTAAMKATTSTFDSSWIRPKSCSMLLLSESLSL